jgi:hypothetical protein
MCIRFRSGQRFPPHPSTFSYSFLGLYAVYTYAFFFHVLLIRVKPAKYFMEILHRGLFQGSIQICFQWLRKSTKAVVAIAGASADVRTEYLPITSYAPVWFDFVMRIATRLFFFHLCFLSFHRSVSFVHIRQCIWHWIILILEPIAPLLQFDVSAMGWSLRPARHDIRVAVSLLQN